MKTVKVFYDSEFGEESFLLQIKDGAKVDDYFFQRRCEDDFYKKYAGIGDKYSDIEFVKVEEIKPKFIIKVVKGPLKDDVQYHVTCEENTIKTTLYPDEAAWWDTAEDAMLAIESLKKKYWIIRHYEFSVVNREKEIRETTPEHIIELKGIKF